MGERTAKTTGERGRGIGTITSSFGEKRTRMVFHTIYFFVRRLLKKKDEKRSPPVEKKKKRAGRKKGKDSAFRGLHERMDG